MQYPDLSSAKMMCVDIETYDPELKAYGPGVYRRDGNILGVGIATNEGFSEYYNFGHKPVNMEERKKNLAFVREALALPCKKLFARYSYDMDWLENWAGIKVNGEIHDIQVAEPLIDENQFSFSLDNLAKKYLGYGKTKSTIEKFCEDHGMKGDARKWLYMMPYDVVRPYVLGDIEEPLDIFEKQWAIMKEQGLLDVYHIEIGIARMLLQMRKNGVRLDVPYVNKMIGEMETEIKKQELVLFNEYGNFNYNSTAQIAPIFDSLGLPYRIIEKTGNPSITADDLALLNHPIAQQITGIKKLSKARKTFFINSFTEARVAGRIHTSFEQLKADEMGTITGRFSSRNPNLQQIPARDKIIGPMCRRAFIPEEGHDWGKIDWSQVEYRIIAHYASGPQSDNIRREYSENPKTDYHQFVMGLTGLDRKPAKNLNFGAAYFMGAKTCSQKFHWSIEEAKELLTLYHSKVPFVRHTGNQVSSIARGRGYVKTIAGRRSRVTPEMLKHRKEFVMFNHLIQGTAADIMKIAMKQGWEKGLFEPGALVPHLTVHDELDVSVPRTKEGNEAFKELKHTMETCVELRVPIIADAEIGKNWQDLEDYKG